MIYARQSTAIIVTVGPMLDADGVAVTGGVVADFKISKNGAAPAALNASATLTHRHTGFYSLSLTATDVNTVGTAEIVIDDTVNACPMKEIQVVEPVVYDALFADAAPGFSTQASVDDLPTNAELATALGTADDAVLAAIAALNNLSAAQVNAEADTALTDAGVTSARQAKLDEVTAARMGSLTDWIDGGRLDLLIDAIKAKSDLLPGSPAAVGSAMTLTSGERDSVAAALLDLAAGVETGRTLRQAMRLILSSAANKLAGAATNTVTTRDTADSKDRITATVDADGNRTAVVHDVT